MIKILITPTTLVFKSLDDATMEKVNQIAPIKYHTTKCYWFIEGDNALLYNVLLKLSYDFDVEIV